MLKIGKSLIASNPLWKNNASSNYIKYIENKLFVKNFILIKLKSKKKLALVSLNRNYTNTVPDTVLDKARRSKLGEIAKGPSVKYEEKKIKPIEYTQADRDYKLEALFLHS